MKIARRNTMQRVILDDFVDREFDCNSNVIINARQSGKKYFNFKPLFFHSIHMATLREKKEMKILKFTNLLREKKQIIRKLCFEMRLKTRSTYIQYVVNIWS